MVAGLAVRQSDRLGEVGVVETALFGHHLCDGGQLMIQLSRKLGQAPLRLNVGVN